MKKQICMPCIILILALYSTHNFLIANENELTSVIVLSMAVALQEKDVDHIFPTLLYYLIPVMAGMLWWYHRNQKIFGCHSKLNEK